MPTRKWRAPDGKEYDVTELGFQNVREHWNEYLLDDGTIVKLKPVATSALRVEGVRDQQGNPVYVIESTNVLTVKPFEKKTGGEGGDRNA